MRRKWVLITAVLVLALSISITAAAPTHQARYAALESLAAYFPADAVAYTSVRADGAYVPAVDSLVDRFVSNVRELNMIDFSELSIVSFQSLLDAAARQFTQGDFETDVRPWLGDSVALGLVPYQGIYQVIIALAVTDQVKAVNAITPWLTQNNWVSTSGTGYTLFTQDNQFDATTIAIFPEALVISSRSLPTVETKGKFVPDLTANPYYNDALALLPEDNYDLIGWVDTPLVLANAAGADSFRQTEDKLLLAALIRLFGPTAFGGTITGDNVISLDMAQAFGNKVGLELLGISLPGSGAVLDPDFLSNVPSDSVLVVHGTNLDGNVAFLTQSLEAIVQNFTPYITSIMYANNSGSGMLSTLLSLNSNLPNIALANIMGLNYERDLRPWLTSDYAVFGGFNPDFQAGRTLYPLVGFGAAFKSSDPAAAANFIRVLGRELPITLNTLGAKGSIRVVPTSIAAGAVALSITLLEYDYIGQSAPYRPIFEIVIGANDSLVVFGTRDVVQRVLSGDAGGFQPVQTSALPNTGAALYANFIPILDNFQQMNQSDMGEATSRDLFRLASLLDSLTITAAGSANSDLFARATLTLR